jgi:hypothetical protein
LFAGSHDQFQGSRRRLPCRIQINRDATHPDLSNAPCRADVSGRVTTDDQYVGACSFPQMTEVGTPENPRRVPRGRLERFDGTRWVLASGGSGAVPALAAPDGWSPLMSVLAVTLGAFLIIPPFVSIWKTWSRVREATQGADTFSLSHACTER